MIDWLIGTAYAAGSQPGLGGGNAQWMQLLIFIVPIAVFYYFLIHMPQKKRQTERKKLMEGLKRGDEVLTSGGLYGRVTGVADQTVNVEISPNPKVRVKIAKSHISQITARSEGEEKIEEQK